MKIRLVYEYKIKDEDGCGTRYDALNVAVRRMEEAISKADSNDDLAEVFKVVEFIVI
jgi:hypothetical protein